MSNGQASDMFKVGERITDPDTGDIYIVESVDEDGNPKLRRTGENEALDQPVSADAPQGDEDKTGAGGLGRLALQGLAFGGSDELRGLGRALNPFDDVKGFRAGYTSGRDEERAYLDRAREEHGAAGVIAELGGTLASGLLVPGGAARLAPTLTRGLRSLRGGKRILSGAGIGAVEGGAYGLLSADEDRVSGSNITSINPLKNPLLGGALLGGAVSKFMPKTTRNTVGAAAPTRGGHIAEVAEHARTGTTRASPIPTALRSFSEDAIPPRVPGQKPGPVGLFRRAAVDPQYVEDIVQAAPGAVPGAVKKGLGLLAPTKKAVARALEPVTEQGSRKLTQLDSALDDAKVLLDKLDDDFTTGWSGKKRPGTPKGNIDQANEEMAELIKDIAKHRSLSRAFTENARNVDATALGDLERLIRNTTKTGRLGAYKPSANVKRLGHREVSALRLNLRSMVGDVDEADIFFKRYDKAYRKLYGSATDKATKAYKDAIQDMDSWRLPRGGPKYLSARKLPRGEMFNIDKLKTKDGLKIAMREIKKHKGVANPERAVKQMLDGLFEKEVLAKLSQGNSDSTITRLANEEEWLRMFFPGGVKGNMRFSGLMKELKAAAKQIKRGNSSQARQGIRSWLIKGGVAGGLTGGGLLAYDLLN